MTQTPPDDIHVISSEELTRLKIVTGDIYSENWSFEIHGDVAYLKADQVTWRGQNKLIFSCPPGSPPTILTLSELPDRESIVREAGTAILVINDQPFTVPRSRRDRQPTMENGRYLSWSVTLTPELVGALKVANRIGSGLSPAPGVFAGILGINVGDGREKLTRFLNDCGAAAQNSALMGPNIQQT